jgi:hypothetical protein
VFRVEVIAPSPDVPIIVEERLSRLPLRHKRTHRLVVSALMFFWAMCFYCISLLRSKRWMRLHLHIERADESTRAVATAAILPNA